jgi:STE24 endopeptidase
MLTPAAPFLIAMFIAFAADTLIPPVVVRPDEVAGCLMEALAGLALAASVAMGLGMGLTAAVRRLGRPTVSTRRGFIMAAYAVEAMNLVVYTWLIHGLGWPEFVRSGLGLRNVFLVDEVLILAPFLLAEVLGWWGLYPAARASRLVSTSRGAGHYLVRKARMTFGTILPAILIFWAGNDLARRIFGASVNDPAVQIGVMGVLGLIVLAIAPAFVRLSWPARPLGPGPIRRRLESLAKRYRFRYTDILVWDTDGSIFNAVVTGATPWFRYILLSDALIDTLSDDEIAAVFGHEMGHIQHRHLAFFGFFCLGSLAVMALICAIVDATFRVLSIGGPGQTIVELFKAGLMLGASGVYFWLTFGLLSRRFERQADVFGCRAVSCGRSDCPPHADRHSPADANGLICRVGVQTCIHALETVAAENGIRPEAKSWRHGSIAKRIEFLRRLDGRPGVERAFQLSVTQLRGVMALLLGSALVLAYLSGAFESLRGI